MQLVTALLLLVFGLMNTLSEMQKQLNSYRAIPLSHQLVLLVSSIANILSTDDLLVVKYPLP